MKCYCFETDSIFTFCVENAKGEIYEILQADQFWKITDDEKFIKVYPMDTEWDDACVRHNRFLCRIIYKFP